jgi:ribosome-binding factor A
LGKEKFKHAKWFSTVDLTFKEDDKVSRVKIKMDRDGFEALWYVDTAD